MEFSGYIERLKGIMTPERFRDYDPQESRPGSPEALREAYGIACGEVAAAAEFFDSYGEAVHFRSYPHPGGIDMAEYLHELTGWVAEVRRLIRSVLNPETGVGPCPPSGVLCLGGPVAPADSESGGR